MENLNSSDGAHDGTKAGLSLSNDRVNKEKGASVAIDMRGLDPKWVTSIRERHLQPKRSNTPSTSISCCIHRVPRCLREHPEEVYVPQVVSIGPFHYDRRKDQLKVMEEYKSRYLHAILQRKGDNHLERFLIAVKNLEEKARRCYSEEVDLDGNYFTEMMVLDGCFIIELFFKKWSGDYLSDPRFNLQWFSSGIERDLLMLENQIPFFILERLCDVMGIDHTSLITWAYFFFRLPAVRHANKPQHLLHLLHCSHVTPFENEKLITHYPTMIPNASKLQEAGIKFKKRVGNGFLDIKFKNGVIEIPTLIVQDGTDVMFLNLIAYEQCYRHIKSYFSAWCYFMVCLLENSKDVQILSENGIIQRLLSSNKDVASVFHKMGGNVCIYDSYLHNVCKEINRYYGTARHSWRASLMRNYFNSPWRILSIVVAIAFFCFACTQTFFTALPKFAKGK